MSEILQAKIATVRRKQVVVAVATGVAAAAGAFVLLLAISMLLDFWLNLPFTARAALLAINLAAVVSILLYSVFGPILYGPDDDEIALMVEDAEPAFRTRLIASIQLSRPAAAPAGASASLIRAMIAQAESLAGPMDFGRVIRTEALTRIIVLALTIFVVVGGVCAWGRDVSGDLLKRALFLSDTPVPRKTGIIVLTGSPLIARGDSIEILAIAERVYPPEGARTAYLKTLPHDKSPSQKQELTLDPVTLDQPRKDAIADVIRASGRPKKEADDLIERLNSSSPPNVFGAKLENRQESFEYTVRLNDADSPKETVRVLPRPAITHIVAEQVYPKYTGLAPKERAMGDLTILRGSKLRLAINANKPLRPDGNVAHLLGSNVNTPLVIDPAEPTRLTGEVDLPRGTTGFSIGLLDTDGLKSKDEVVYRIDLVEDKAPTVRIVAPNRKEILTVREGQQVIGFQAADDFAISAAAIKYKLDDGPEETINLDLKGQTPKAFTRGHEWKISTIRPAGATLPPDFKPLVEGSVIEYWVEVQDNRDAPNGGPNKGLSEHNMIRIGSEADVRKVLRDHMAEIGTALHTATDEQESVANKVQIILLEKKVSPPTPTPTPK